MSYAQITTAVKQRYVDNANLLATTVVQFPNQPFNPPTNAVYGKLAVVYNGRVAAEMGGELDEIEGTCVIEVVSPEDESTESHDAICTEVLGFYSAVDIGALRFKVGRVETLGVTAGRYRSKVVIPFIFYAEV